ERFLGAELFGRSIDYETSTDAVVRVRANDVRRRLAQYGSTRKSATPIRIELIAGGYIPEFHCAQQEVSHPVATNQAIQPASPSAVPSGTQIAPVEPPVVPYVDEQASAAVRPWQHLPIFWMGVT